MTDNSDIHSCSFHCVEAECIKAQRDELRAQVAALEREAARYRWFRDGDSGNTSIFMSLYYDTKNAVELDAAIDAAMSTATEPPDTIGAVTRSATAGA